MPARHFDADDCRVPLCPYDRREKVDELKNFTPTGIAGRILGQGDVVSLVERTLETVDRSLYGQNVCV